MAGRARLAVAWATGFQLFRDVVQFGLTITLVRLLPAEVYGQFGFFTTLLTFFTIYSFREFLNHTLQVRGGDVVHYQDHFTAGAVVQAIVVVVVNGVAIGLRWFPAYAAVSPVLHVMSVLFVLDLPSEFRVKMLERELDWRRLRFLQGVGFVVGGLVSVALALSGVRVLALLLPTLIAPLPFIYDLFVTARWRPTWAFDWDRFRPAWRFGWTRIATVSFVSVASLTETTWLTGVLGFALLGIYGRAMGLAQLLCGRIAGLLSLAVYPVLTRLTPDTDSYRRASAMYLRTVGWAVVPLAAIFSMLAAPVVNLIYGKTWIEAIPLVPFAMAVAAVSAIAQTAYTLLLASGRQGPCLVADAWRLAGTLIALVVALPFGAAGYLVAMSALQCVSLVIVVGFLLRGRAVTPAGLLQAIVPALVSTGLAAGAASIGAAGSPVATGVVFFGVYVVALRVLFASACAELVGYLPQSGRLSRWLRLAPPTPA
jgi:teichuronic acid exporter